MAKFGSKGFVDDGTDDLIVEGSIVMSESPTSPAKAATTTPIVGGVYTVSGDAVVTVTMPLASTVPGSTFVFRTTSVHAHVLTGSAWPLGEKAFSGVSGSLGQVDGQAIVFPAVIGSSVALLSDGNKFLLIGCSGSINIKEN